MARLFQSVVCNCCGIHIRAVKRKDYYCLHCTELITFIKELEHQQDEGQVIDQRALAVRLTTWMNKKEGEYPPEHEAPAGGPKVDDRIFNEFMDRLLKKLIPDTKIRRALIFRL